MSTGAFSTSPDRAVTRASACARCSRTSKSVVGRHRRRGRVPDRSARDDRCSTAHNGLSGDTVTALLEDRQRPHLGRHQRRARCSSNTTASHRCSRCSMPRAPTAVHLIHEDRGGNLWVATESQRSIRRRRARHAASGHGRRPAQRLGHLHPRGRARHHLARHDRRPGGVARRQAHLA